MEKKIKGFLIDPERRTAQAMEIDNSLDGFYNALGCTCIDIVTRRIGRKAYSIICDDEGLFVDDPKISAIDDLGRPQLVGALFIVSAENNDGDLVGITTADVNYIKRFVNVLGTRLHPEGWPMLCSVGI